MQQVYLIFCLLSLDIVEVLMILELCFYGFCYPCLNMSAASYQILFFFIDNHYFS